MAGAACKIIINMMLAAITKGLEQVLMSPLVRDEMLSAEKCGVLIQRLADIDLAVYGGGRMPAGGLAAVLLELEREGVLTEEVWEILRKPDPSES